MSIDDPDGRAKERRKARNKLAQVLREQRKWAGFGPFKRNFFYVWVPFVFLVCWPIYGWYVRDDDSVIGTIIFGVYMSVFMSIWWHRYNRRRPERIRVLRDRLKMLDEYDARAEDAVHTSALDA